MKHVEGLRRAGLPRRGTRARRARGRQGAPRSPPFPAGSPSSLVSSSWHFSRRFLKVLKAKSPAAGGSTARAKSTICCPAPAPRRRSQRCWWKPPGSPHGLLPQTAPVRPRALAASLEPLEPGRRQPPGSAHPLQGCSHPGSPEGWSSSGGLPPCPEPPTRPFAGWCGTNGCQDLALCKGKTNPSPRSYQRLRNRF